MIEPAQSYFRETDLPSLLCSLLFFTPHVQPDQAVPQEFALQFWNEDKTTNAGLILEAIGLLLGSKGAGVGYNATLLKTLSVNLCSFRSSERATLSLDCSSKWHWHRTRQPQSRSRYRSNCLRLL
jgi:hypothetical protein